MSGISEPRRNRKRYNLVPRGKAIYEGDDNHFGKRMMQKMGWTEGKGLGVREDGDQEFVRLRYKNDADGFGYKDRDDQWTEHEQDFNSLLSSLNNDEQSKDDNKLEKIKAKISGESLELKSEKSKTRLHYKKFTKSKDVSQYDEKHLANIFGKQLKTSSITKECAQKTIETPIVENNKTEEDFYGIQTINTGTTISDYFASKKAEMKGQLMPIIDENVKIELENCKNVKEEVLTEQINDNNINLQDEDREIVETIETISEKKKKSRRKRKTSIDQDVESTDTKVKKIETEKNENCENQNEVAEITISEYCAEKFRHVDLNLFSGSNLAHIIGYTMPDNFKVKIESTKLDTWRIQELWKDCYDWSLIGQYSKYCRSGYFEKVDAARKAKKKVPQVNVKRMKNKSIFTKI